jgi:hypothetical protein
VGWLMVERLNPQNQMHSLLACAAGRLWSPLNLCKNSRRPRSIIVSLDLGAPKEHGRCGLARGSAF